MAGKMVIHEPEIRSQLDWPNATVLGLDPSMTSTGWSITQFYPGAPPVVVAHGWIGTEPTGVGQNMRDNLMRMNLLYDLAKPIVQAAVAHGVSYAAIELPTPHGHGSSSQSGSMACVAMGIAVDQVSIPTAYVHPTHSKKVVTGNGKAQKAEVKEFVCRWVNRPDWGVRQDITDSVSAALTTGLDIIEDRFDYPDILESLQ